MGKVVVVLLVDGIPPRRRSDEGSSPEEWCRSLVGMVFSSGRQQCTHLHDWLTIRRPGQHGLERLDREVAATDTSVVVLIDQLHPGAWPAAAQLRIRQMAADMLARRR